MMINLSLPIKKRLSMLLAAAGITSLIALMPGDANAAATLKQRVMVSTNIVTIGDMFDNAGNLAERALFRAPNIGTTGHVPVEAITTAVLKYGLSNFDFGLLQSVTVERPGKILNINDLRRAIEAHVRLRGMVDPLARIELTFTDNLPNITYGTMEESEPRIIDLRFAGSNVQGGQFEAFFALPGQKNFHRAAGYLTEMLAVPHLNKALRRGTIIQPADINYEFIVKQRTLGFDIAEIEDIVGQSLKSSKRAGSIVTNRDLVAPILIKRNQTVSLILKSGALTLTVKGQALSSASHGDTVKVLNLKSKKIITGIALSSGTVLVGGANNTVASL